jgi:hypothetical protein
MNDNRTRLLAIASRPSDYVEMADLARALVSAGHHVTLIYFYSDSDPSRLAIFEQMAALQADAGVFTRAIDVDNVRPRVEQPAATVAAPEVVVERRTYFGALRNFALWLRERNLDWYPKNTGALAYAIARTLDGILDPRHRAYMKRMMALLRTRANSLGDMPLLMRVETARRVHQAAGMGVVYRNYVEFFDDIIDRERIDAVLIPEDIVGNIWPVVINTGHKRGIPTLVLPYTLANREEAVQGLKDVPAFQTKQNKVAARMYPKWRYREKGIDLVRLPSSHIFAHEDLGITPPDPWMMNSGYSDKILVDSQATLEYFLAGGIPRSQLSIVGSVSQDRMFRLRQNRAAHLEQLRRELGLSGDKPLLLISGCPNQLTSPVPYCEFNSIAAVAAHVGESVAPLAAEYHLVVRPHPNFVEFGALLEPFGIVTSTQPTSSLVPLADLFVAFASATIRWAIACGIPTVNYDVFTYGYGDFAAAKGVATVSGSKEFRDLVRSLVPGSAPLQAHWSRAQAAGAHWSMMDGQSLSRIEAEIAGARERCAAAKKESLQHA